MDDGGRVGHGVGGRGHHVGTSGPTLVGGLGWEEEVWDGVGGEGEDRGDRDG